MKERYAVSQMRKQANRMTFGEVSDVVMHSCQFCVAIFKLCDAMHVCVVISRQLKLLE